MTARGPTLPSVASAGHGGYLGISCRQWGWRSTAESGPTLPTLAVQQDGSYLGCTGNRLAYGPARRRFASDNVSSRMQNRALISRSTPLLNHSKSR
jgi:hypothetical protein